MSIIQPEEARELCARVNDALARGDLLWEVEDTEKIGDLAHTVVQQDERIAAFQQFVKQCEHDEVSAVPVSLLATYAFENGAGR